MSLEQLKQTDFYKEQYHNMWDVKTGYFWYYFQPIEIKGYQISFSLCFFGNQLDIIHMNTWENGDAKDWNEWTEEKEMKVFHRNNTFLTKILDRPPTQKKEKPLPKLYLQISLGRCMVGLRSEKRQQPDGNQL